MDKSILSVARGEFIESRFEVKRSKFITRCYRVDTVEQAREAIAQTRRDFPDARHHCTCFSVMESADGDSLDLGKSVTSGIEVLRSNDDGEPSGTAGIPMLEVLKGSQLKNVVFIAVRYFGGIKLGTGGLVSAYTQCVTDCIKACYDNKKVVSIGVVNTYSFRVSMNDYGYVSAQIYNHAFEVTDTIFLNDSVDFILAIAQADFHSSIEILSNITQSKATLEFVGTKVIESKV